MTSSSSDHKHQICCEAWVFVPFWSSCRGTWAWLADRSSDRSRRRDTAAYSGARIPAAHTHIHNNQSAQSSRIPACNTHRTNPTAPVWDTDSDRNSAAVCPDHPQTWTSYRTHTHTHWSLSVWDPAGEQQQSHSHTLDEEAGDPAVAAQTDHQPTGRTAAAVTGQNTRVRAAPGTRLQTALLTLLTLHTRLQRERDTHTSWIESQTCNLKVTGSSLRSGRDCRWGEWITSALFHLNTMTEDRPLSKNWTHNCSGCVFTVCVCVHCCVCALKWVKCSAQTPSMGHTSLHFTHRERHTHTQRKQTESQSLWGQSSWQQGQRVMWPTLVLSEFGTAVTRWHSKLQLWFPHAKLRPHDRPQENGPRVWHGTGLTFNTHTHTQRERERETHTHRETERETHTHTHTERDTHTQRERHTNTERERDTETHTHTHTHTHRDTHRDNDSESLYFTVNIWM